MTTTYPHWLRGLGIRRTPEGPLWRISTGDAVKVERDADQAFLIGSNEAGALRDAIAEHVRRVGS